MMYYDRCFNLGVTACVCILEDNGIISELDPCIQLAESIEFGDVDEIDLIIAESCN
jgi:hypothetical protein